MRPPERSPRRCSLAGALFLLSLASCATPAGDGHFDEEDLETLAYLPIVDGQVRATEGRPVPYEAEVRALWDELRRRLPASTLGALAQVRGIRVVDGEDAPPGAAGPVHDDPRGPWEILLGRDALEDDEDFLWTVVHEYGHVLSLGDRGITLREDVPHLVPSGPRFGEFHERYWERTGLFEALLEINPEASFDPRIEGRFIDYVQRESGRAHEFVSEFAMVSPEEDFTETFAAYVLGDVPEGNGPVGGGGREKLAWFAETYPKAEAEPGD